MSTDRELLEKAAKAAGILGKWDDDRAGLEIAVPWRNFTNYETWNPLTDDGDALRLAVKLDIDLLSSTGNGPSVVYPLRGDFDGLTEWCDKPNEKLNATRRAIVRAAAAIGESMP